MTRKNTRLIGLLWAAALVLFGTSTVLAQTAQKIAKRAFGSTVLLVMEDANGQTLSLGSGFFVRDDEIASNLHVIEGADRGYAKIIGQKAKYDIEGITAVVLAIYSPATIITTTIITISKTFPLLFFLVILLGFKSFQRCHYLFRILQCCF